MACCAEIRPTGESDKNITCLLLSQEIHRKGAREGDREKVEREREGRKKVGGTEGEEKVSKGEETKQGRSQNTIHLD